MPHPQHGARSLNDAVAGRDAAGEILFLTGRTRLDPAAAARLATLLRGPLDWEQVLWLPLRHHTYQLLYRHVADVAPDAVPPRVLAELRRRYNFTAASNMRAVHALLGLLDQLEGAGAPAVLWKGPALALTVYPSPELRVFRDLDIIVRQQDLGRVGSVLASNGYVAKYQPGAEDRLFLRPGQDVTVWNPDTEIQLDVHSGTIQRYWSPAMECDRLWRQSEQIRIYGRSIRILEPESHLIALCLHGAKHRPHPWPALKWVSDIDAFVRFHPSDRWEPILARAAAEGYHRRVLLGLLLAHDLLDTPLPETVERAIARDGHVTGLVPAIRERMLEPDRDFSFAERLRFDLAARERAQDRIVYRMRRVLTPGKRDEQPTSAAMQPLGVPKRLLRLSRRYLFNPRAAWSLVRGGGSATVRGPDD